MVNTKIGGLLLAGAAVAAVLLLRGKGGEEGSTSTAPLQNLFRSQEGGIFGSTPTQEGAGVSTYTYNVAAPVFPSAPANPFQTPTPTISYVGGSPLLKSSSKKETVLASIPIPANPSIGLGSGSTVDVISKGDWHITAPPSGIQWQSPYQLKPVDVSFRVEGVYTAGTTKKEAAVQNVA